MRFGQRKEKPKYVLGDKRVISWFAILPVCIKGEWRWLERVTVQQEVVPFVDGMMEYTGITWENKRFIDDAHRSEWAYAIDSIKCHQCGNNFCYYSEDKSNFYCDRCHSGMGDYFYHLWFPHRHIFPPSPTP